MMRAEEIAARIDWPNVLAQLGVPKAALCNKHGPCPACGGKDRFRFDNRRGRGDFICGQCGAGSGFDLLMRVHGWDFRTARDHVVQAAGLRDATTAMAKTLTSSATIQQEIAQPPARVLRLRRESCALADCSDAVEYLVGRHLWPLPEGYTLRAHPAAEYFEAGQRMGRYPAQIAEVRDLAGELVTLHVTYLKGGLKLKAHEPRKILSPLTGRAGCAVRLQRVDGEVLGVCEGIETAIAAATLHGVPVWAALNTALLARFEPPPEIRQLLIFSDRDIVGLEAAAHLMQRLQGQMVLQVKPPAAPAKDWADVLVAKHKLKAEPP
jgi:putative DNA primase/helicase